MSTIVTAFITNINNIEFRSYEKYIELGKILLSQPIPTICFLEKYIYDEYFKHHESQYPQTLFRIFERADNYLYEYEPILENFLIETDNPKKDTPGYMFIQCHKTEWIKMAIDENPFHTSNFVWIDFGIFHMIRDELQFAVALKKLVRKKYDSVRIASCIDPNLPCHCHPEKNIKKNVLWFFAGSIFGGNKSSLLHFANRMKEFTIEFIQNNRHIMWEVNIWYLLHQKHKDIFLPYRADHNLSILSNY